MDYALRREEKGVKRTSLHLPEHLIAEMRVIGAESGATVAAIVRIACERYLSEKRRETFGRTSVDAFGVTAGTVEGARK